MFDLCKRGDRLNVHDKACGCGLFFANEFAPAFGGLFQVEEASQLFGAGGVA